MERFRLPRPRRFLYPSQAHLLLRLILVHYLPPHTLLHRPLTSPFHQLHFGKACPGPGPTSPPPRKWIDPFYIFGPLLAVCCPLTRCFVGERHCVENSQTHCSSRMFFTGSTTVIQALCEILITSGFLADILEPLMAIFAYSANGPIADPGICCLCVIFLLIPAGFRGHAHWLRCRCTNQSWWYAENR